MYKRKSLPDSIIAEPHFYNPNIVVTNQNWELIQGTFIADSAYQYMLLGNFLSLTDPRFQSTRIIPNNYSHFVSYYYDKFELIKTDPDRKFSIDIIQEPGCFPVNVSFIPNNVNPGTYWK